MKKIRLGRMITQADFFSFRLFVKEYLNLSLYARM